MPQAPMSVGQSGRRPILGKKQQAFTLMEVLVGAAVMAMVMVGVLGSLSYSYKINYTIRCRDQARAILSSFTDQFIRYNVVNPTTLTNNELFSITSAPTGEHLSWKGKVGDASGLEVTLGDTSGAGGVVAIVKREVSHLNETSGAQDTDTSTTAAGFMLKGTFTIEYAVGGKNYKETFVVTKSAQ